MEKKTHLKEEPKSPINIRICLIMANPDSPSFLESMKESEKKNMKKKKK
jgi:hypothetical protein